MSNRKTKRQSVSKTKKSVSGKRSLNKLSCSKSKRKKANYLSEVKALRSRERQLIKKGFKYIVGTDEAGRGPLAGPVVAAACYVPPDIVIDRVGDSKGLTEEQREECFKQLTNNPRIFMESLFKIITSLIALTY